jgi:uncharacterized protein DUF1206
MSTGSTLDTPDAVRRPAEKARADARTGRGWYATLARIGLVAKGVSYGIVAVLAIKLAVGGGGKATSRGGALQTLADEPLGKLLIGALAFGFAAYAIWRFVQAFAEPDDPTEDEAKSEAKKWGKRAGYIGRGLIYAGLTFTAVKILLGSGGGESQNETAKKSAGAVFDWPAGRWIVGLAGLAIIGAGAWNVYRGVTTKFEDKWRSGEMSRTERTWGTRVAVVGHIARGIVFGLVGVFIAKAAWEYDPKEAIGLDGALQKLASAPHGPWVLGVTAAGLLCYGLFCFVDARYRDVSAGSSGGAGSASSEPQPARA